MTLNASLVRPAGNRLPGFRIGTLVAVAAAGGGVAACGKTDAVVGYPVAWVPGGAEVGAGAGLLSHAASSSRIKMVRLSVLILWIIISSMDLQLSLQAAVWRSNPHAAKGRLLHFVRNDECTA